MRPFVVGMAIAGVLALYLGTSGAGARDLRASLKSNANRRCVNTVRRTPFADSAVLSIKPAQQTAQADIRVVDLKGLEAAIAADRGKPLLVNFWAIWCQPCVEELPEFLEVGRAAREQGGAVLTVSYDLMVPDVTREGVLKQMREYVAAHKIDAPVLIYDAPDYDAINERFGLPGPVPATIAIDRNGAVVDRLAGKADRARFEAMMRKARGE